MIATRNGAAAVDADADVVLTAITELPLESTVTGSGARVDVTGSPAVAGGAGMHDPRGT